MRTDGPVTVAVVDPHDLIAQGLTHVLNERSGGRYLVVPLCRGGRAPEVVLYGVDQDTTCEHDPTLHHLIHATASKIIVTYWGAGSPRVDAARSCGAYGAVSKKLRVHELLARMDRLLSAPHSAAVFVVEDECRSPIERVGLTARESDVLGLVGEGLTNHQIAARLYVSINTVKTYVRTAYRKIGATRRAQAVAWVHQNQLSHVPTGVMADDDEAAE